ncbi:MAG: glycerol-3-phosphate dehydrogenase [Bacillota bacterium]
MSIIAIVGAGMMGSAMSVPACDNGHEVRIIGTHLDREIIDHARTTHEHLTMKRTLPPRAVYYQIEELEEAIKDADVIIGGVSSFGVDWFSENVIPLVGDGLPILSVTKGMHNSEDGSFISFPELYRQRSAGRLSFNAIGGPCTSYELADRRHSAVVFCGEDLSVLRRLRQLLETDYYHISLSTDVTGVECAVAMKNAYALGVTLAIGMIEKQEGPGCVQAYNTQAALFGQSVREMRTMIHLLGGRSENIVYAAGDLYVTVFGGRTRMLGTLLGRGYTFSQAMQELHGITLESVSIAACMERAVNRLIERGLTKRSSFPLLEHIGKLLREEQTDGIPFSRFETTET